jgi:hypothetical protein
MSKGGTGTIAEKKAALDESYVKLNTLANELPPQVKVLRNNGPLASRGAIISNDLTK